ncbi:MAG: 1,4-alpha-glucan branching protein GlgB [Planctomycetota bacterium]
MSPAVLDPAEPSLPPLPMGDRNRLLAVEHPDPHSVLGPHALKGKGVVLRAYHPDAIAIDCLRGDHELALDPVDDGLFAALLPEGAKTHPYRLRYTFPDGSNHEVWDPYGFSPSLGELDLHLIGEGRHLRLWEALGAHAVEHEGVDGVRFTVWAPAARRVSVVGDWNRWDGRRHPMRSLGRSGVWELFVPEARVGQLYKLEVKTATGAIQLKADPLARSAEPPPGTASRIAGPAHHQFQDAAWMSARRTRDLRRAPLSIYEVHLGSWRRDEQGRQLNWRALAPLLVEHCRRYGFDHVELLPQAAHPFYGSWGYLVGSFYAPTTRHGEPDDLRYFVDALHQAGIGVILDWVPGHFPRDAVGLGRFDGTALYEHLDPRRGEQPDWGTYVFNLGRNEVRNFLLANALYWLESFHIDGLRVDAVASMLYLDYSRQEGQWVPNVYGGRENLEAIELLRELNTLVHQDHPGCFTVAEESTAWPDVTRSPTEGGLGFDFKWNMGWMHDTLRFFARDPVHRGHHLDELTFAMLYEYSERFVMPLSHDEVVHGKGALLRKLPGDAWQRAANLRLLLSYQFTRPGKQLLFMGAELLTLREWSHDAELEWYLAEREEGRRYTRFLQALGQLYRDQPALWRRDHEPGGFRWIDCHDRENVVLSYERRDGDDHVLVVLNLTPVPRHGYRVGAPLAGRYRRVFDSDAGDFGGSAVESLAEVEAEPVPYHDRPGSLLLTLPPLAALVYAPARG